MAGISGQERLSLVREIRYPDDDKKKRLNRHKRSRAWLVTIASKYVCGDWSVVLDELNDMTAYGWSYMGQAEEGTGKRMTSSEGKRPVDAEGDYLYGRGGKYRGFRHAHFIVYTPRMRMGTFADHFPTQAHIDPVDRTPKVVERYVTKLDTRLTLQDDGVDGGPWESEGFDPRGQGKRTDLKTRDDAVRKVLAGAIPDVLMRDDPRLIAYDRYLDRAYEIAMKEKGKRMRDVHTLYVYGKTGAGKSLWAWLYGQRHGRDVYRLTDYAHPWDNYRGEPVVVVEDFDGRMRLDDVLRWTDRYPTELTARYANKHALYDTVIFTSNRQMSGWYGSDEFEPKQGPLNRRITTVCVSLGSDGDTVHFRHVAGPEWITALPDESLRAMIGESNGVAPSGADGRGCVEKPETATVETPQPVTKGEAHPVDTGTPTALPFAVGADGIPVDLG